MLIATPYPLQFPLLRFKLKGRLVRDRGDGGLNQVSHRGPGVALVNHFDWIKASEALNNVRGQSGQIKHFVGGGLRAASKLRSFS